jgi:hypothetical protein
MKAALQNLGILVVLLLIVLFEFRSCSIPTQEKGFLGVDAYGRSALASVLNASAPSSIRFSTDFYDRSLISRLWRPPMNTTLRMNQSLDMEGEVMMRGMEGFAQENELLAPLTNGFFTAPLDALLYGYDPVYLTKENQMSAPKFKALAADKGAKNVREMLRGFGFTTFEWFVNGEKKVTMLLNTNVINAAGNDYMMVIGSKSNSPGEMLIQYHSGWKKDLPSNPKAKP